MNRYALAVDVGATKVALALVDRSFAVKTKQEVFVQGNEKLWEDIASITTQLLNGHQRLWKQWDLVCSNILPSPSLGGIGLSIMQHMCWIGAPGGRTRFI